MNEVSLTEQQIIRLLEQGSVDAGSCTIVNVDVNKEVKECQ